MRNLIRPAIVSLVLLTVITGVAYPLLITAIATIAFPKQAAGSVISVNGKAVGSSLIAQAFTDDKYFWPRPSSAGASGYDATSGSGSNLGPSNPALTDAVQARLNALQKANPLGSAAVPIDLVTTSGSGLDPHISLAAAEYQIDRVSQARHLSHDVVKTFVSSCTSGQLFGQPVVNVLELNLLLDYPEKAMQLAADGNTNHHDRGFLPDAH